jgi:hypothetical protein
MLRYLFPLLLIASSSFGQVKTEPQDFIVTMRGDTIPCSVKFTGPTFGVVLNGDDVATEVLSDTIRAFRHFGLWRIPELQTGMKLDDSRHYLKNAGTGFAVAGVLTVLGSGVLVVGNVLAQRGQLDLANALTPSYFGYGLLVVAGLTTIGASVSLSKAGKSLPKVRLRVANVTVK